MPFVLLVAALVRAVDRRLVAFIFVLREQPIHHPARAVLAGNHAVFARRFVLGQIFPKR